MWHKFAIVILVLLTLLFGDRAITPLIYGAIEGLSGIELRRETGRQAGEAARKALDDWMSNRRPQE